DAQGHAQFTVPVKGYKFRIDYNGHQYWTSVITPIAHQPLAVEVPLEQLALMPTNDPKPSRYDGEAPVYVGEPVKVASLGSLIGLMTQTTVAQVSQPKVYYYLTDHLGTPQKVIDATGAVVWSGDYKAFGEVMSSVSTVQNHFRFPRQYYDHETALNYNYHRYYQTMVGRYLTPDPIGQVGGINLYPYVGDNSINFADLFGLIWVTLEKDYDGTSNWFRGVLMYLSELIGGGMNPQLPSSESFLGATRKVTQRWEHDPENPCEDAKHSYGSLREFDQTYMKNWRAHSELTPNYPEPYYYQWRPNVPDRTYLEVPEAKIYEKTLFIQSPRR
ncbi:MAG: RHS domain-containing protein, partial [Dehalococcoidales bacterium]|nr:RHS domain-containing protein [Dehalococcoidales bacterium]